MNASGKCGENLYWTLTDNYSVLTISGTGRMDNYTYWNADGMTDAPWAGAKDYVTTLIIEDGVEYIGNSAFWGFWNLQEVDLGEGLAEVGHSVFRACYSLKSITIPASVRKVGLNAFFLCHRLTNVYSPDLAAWCQIDFADAAGNPAAPKSWEGRVITATLHIAGEPMGSTLTVPETVTKIGSYAFYALDLERVQLHDQIEAIGDVAFAGNKITEITLPKNVSEWGADIFEDCDLLTRAILPEDLTVVSAGLFRNCDQLQSIVIPANVVSIGDSAFQNCKMLSSVSIPDGVCVIGSNAFSNCKMLSSISIPDGVSVIGGGAFSYCTMETIELPEQLKTIGDSAFYQCTNLTKIEVPQNVKAVGNYVFKECTALQEVVLSADVECIGDGAFSGCAALSSMKLPDGITQIGAEAFKGCAAWQNVSIPKSVVSIGAQAYEGCLGMKSVSIPQSTVSVGENAFSGCCNVKSVVIAQSMTGIPNGMFAGCSGITEITIPAAVASIGDNAFNGCAKLKTVVFAGNAPTISASAFKNVTATCWYPAGDETYTLKITTDDFGGDLIWTYVGENQEDKYRCGDSIIWELTDSGVLVLTGSGEMYDYCASEYRYAPWYEKRNSVKSVRIGEGITHVGNDAFYLCSSLATISLPSTLKSVGSNAFSKTALTSLTLPEGVTDVGEGAFAEARLKNVVLPDSLTYLPDRVFYFNPELRQVTLPKKLVSIGERAFQSCVELNGMTLPDGLVSIGDYAFANCGASEIYGGDYSPYYFTYVKLPDTLKTIGEGAFKNCQVLTSIHIPDSVTVIGDYAFAGCKNISKASLSANLERLGTEAFYQNSNLESLTFRWKAPKFPSNLFSRDMTKIIAYYPSNNEAWTSNLLKNYGAGNIVWKPIEMDDPAFGGGGGNTDGGNDDNNSGEAGGSGDNESSGDSEGGDGNPDSEGGNSGGSGNAGSGDGSDSGNNSGSGDNSGSGENTQPGSGSGEDCEHDYVSVITTVPTCTETGVRTYTCKNNASHTYAVTIPAKGHAYEVVDATAPTCNENGEQTCVCSACDHTYTETIAAKGHTSVQVAAQAPTCTEVGWNAYEYCSVCDYTTYEEIPATGHSHNAVVTAPTCTEQGYTTHTCACGDSYVTDYVDATGHSYGSDHFCSCRAEEPLYVAFHSLSLKGDIGVNYYLHIDESILADETAFMRFTTPKGTVEIPLSQAEERTRDGKTCYGFTATVSAKEMTNIIVGQFFYDGGSSAEMSYSVKAYADTILENKSNAEAITKVQPLIRAMLNYGAFAQIQFKYNTDNLATDISSVDLSGVTAETLAGFANSAKQGTALAPLYASSLFLKSETNMRLIFNAAEGVAVTATCGDKALAVSTVSGMQCVEVTNISAKNLDTWYEVEINDGTETAVVTYNPMTYSYNVLNAKEGTYAESLLNLVKALYLYNQAANGYFE